MKSEKNISWVLLFMVGFATTTVAQKPTLPAPYTSGTPVNYIRVWTATAPSVDEASFNTSTSMQRTQLTTQYFDGLGRPLQTVLKKGALATSATNIQDTTTAEDLVTPVLYDEYGREQYKFSPFVSTSSDGNLKTDPFVQQQQFMNGKYGTTQGEDYFYNQTIFEASPLNRVLEQFAPGKNWAGSYQSTMEETRHSIKSKYWINTVQDSVRIWEVTDGSLGSGGGSVPATLTIGSGHTTAVTEYKALQSITFTDGFYAPSGSTLRAYITSNSSTPSTIITSSYASSRVYPAGELYKNVTVDEQGRQIIEFKDKEGRLILKKVQLENTAADIGQGKGHWGWLCTYYIYDDFGNLRCVIQPEGVRTMNDTNSWILTAVLLKEQCFRYEYDGWKRMIVKQVPGAAEVVMVYDVRDRLVMTQDGNLRSQGNWNYTQYDNLNRPVKTGLVNLQGNDPNTHWNAAMSKTGDANDAVQYPTNDLLSNATVLTETFYDDYGWVSQTPHSAALPAGFSDYDNSLDAGNLAASDNPNFPYEQKNVKDTRTKGLITGTRINILGTPNYIYTLTIYDSKARPIQVKTKNHTTGMDLMTTQYSWSGQPLVVVSKESKAMGTAITVTTVTKNTYDVLGRLVKTTKNVSSSNGLSSGDKIIAVNKYDELGQLVNKTLGATDVNGATGAETQNYEYNVRGWLLGMNRGYAGGSNNNSNFGFELNYDQYPAFGGSVGNRYYNGNIGGMSWRGKTGNAEIRRYDFSYDNASRIMNADFKQYNGSSFAAAGTFNSRMGDGNPSNPESAYDYNGNIRAMTQQGLYNGSSTTIDQLTYSYKPNSNKLLKVKDNISLNTGLGDFNDGSNGDNEDYDYDANGNLVKDGNKNISGISYNILNLPQQVDVTGKGTISYQYDAAGNKLSKTVNETGQGQKITTYLGGMIFENDVLQHVAMEEGRLRPNGTAFTADYFLKDHLGNVRSMINEDKTLLEETHYYPFGLTMKGISYQNTSVAKNKKKFNGYEEQKNEFSDGSGLDWYDYKNRFYDNQIGRFFTQDKLADEYPYYAPYQFAGNEVPNAIDLDGLEPGYIHPEGYYVGPSDNLRRTIPKGAIIAGPTEQSKESVSGVLDFIPVLGDIKGFREGITGKDSFTGEELSLTSRLMGIFLISELKFLNKADEIAGAIKTLGKEQKQLEKSKGSFEALIKEHKQKIEDFKKDPVGKSDPKLLEGKSKEVQQKIMDGRVKALEKQVKKQEGELNKVNQRLNEVNKAIEEANKKLQNAK